MKTPAEIARDYRERHRDDPEWRSRQLATAARGRERHREQRREAERARRLQPGFRERENERNRLRRIRHTATTSIWKEAQGCSACGERSGRLDYHHIDPATKRYNVTKMWSTSLDTLLDEIAKCIVLCPSCHTKLHANG